MLKKIEEAVANKHPALRARTRFQPMGGPGDVLYPPTYVGGGDPRHERIIDGQTVDCVVGSHEAHPHHRTAHLGAGLRERYSPLMAPNDTGDEGTAEIRAEMYAKADTTPCS